MGSFRLKILVYKMSSTLSKFTKFLSRITFVLLFSACFNNKTEYSNSMDLFTVQGLLLHYIAYSSDAKNLVARHSHSTNLMLNGKTLIVGGYNGSIPLSSSKLYDPDNGEITTSGNLQYARFKHTATLLENGNVLVTGGKDVDGYSLDSVELYEQDTGSFTSMESLSQPRHEHTATLLTDGRVLLAGGCKYYFDTTQQEDIVDVLQDADIFNPDSNSFVSVSMNQARCQHRATLLANGLVLISGGVDAAGSNLSSSEIFDPNTNSFRFTTLSLNEGRSSHTATLLLDGKVLIAGGISNLNDLSSAEIYDPATDAFSYLTNKSSMAQARVSHTASLLHNGKVLLAGGNLTDTKLELYDPTNEIFDDIGSLPFAVLSHTSTVLPNAKVVIIGGDTGENSSSNIYLYDYVE